MIRRSCLLFIDVQETETLSNKWKDAYVHCFSLLLRFLSFSVNEKELFLCSHTDKTLHDLTLSIMLILDYRLY